MHNFTNIIISHSANGCHKALRQQVYTSSEKVTAIYQIPVILSTLKCILSAATSIENLTILLIVQNF